MTETWTILSPVAPKPARPAADTATTAVPTQRPIAGLRVGFEVDYAWNCYRFLIDEWETLLRADGAAPRTLWIEESRNQKVAKSKEQIRSDIDDWSRLVECGVVGLGN